jgi:hypothetical protein
MEAGRVNLDVQISYSVFGTLFNHRCRAGSTNVHMKWNFWPWTEAGIFKDLLGIAWKIDVEFKRSI